MPAFEGVAFVGQQLANQIHQRHLAGHQDALLTIGRKAHIGHVQGQRLGTANGLFAKTLHVERHFLLALGDDHAVVENPRLEHGTHAFTQDFDRNAFSPWAECLTLIVEHPNQAFGEVSGIGRFDIYRGLADETGIVQMQVREIGFTAWTARRFRNVQAQGFVFVHGLSLRSLLSCVFVGRWSLFNHWTPIFPLENLVLHKS